jgi:hypothetical protein
LINFKKDLLNQLAQFIPLFKGEKTTIWAKRCKIHHDKLQSKIEFLSGQTLLFDTKKIRNS